MPIRPQHRWLCNDNFGVRLTTTEMAGFQVWFRNR